MTDLFLSYAREDKDLAIRIREALRDRGWSVWLDQQEIPPGLPDFWREIESNIESAGAFLFLISPDSARSPHCKRELTYALTRGKPLIAILWRDTPDEQVPGILKEINWIDFLRQHFETALEHLATALKMDWEHRRQGAHLLTFALAWRAALGDSSKGDGYLLRGDELQEALRWRDTAEKEAKEPRPTEIHKAFLAASAEAERRHSVWLRRRSRLIWGTLGIAVLLGIATTVFLVRDRILTRSEMARQLALQSRFAATQPTLLERSLLLALESMQWSPNLEADHLLRSGLLLLARPALQISHGASINAIAFSPLGDLLVTAGDDHEAKVWDASTGRLRADLPHPNPVRSTTFGASGEVLFAATSSGSSQGTMEIWDLVRTRSLGHLDFGAGQYDVAMTTTSDGRYVAVARTGNRSDRITIPRASGNPVRVYDARAGRQLLERIFEGRVASFALTEDVKYLVVLGREGNWRPGAAAEDDWIELGGDRARYQLRVLEVATGRALSGFTGDADVKAFALDSKGTLLATASPQGDVALWELSSGREIARRRHDGPVSHLEFSPDARRLAGASGAHVQIWDDRLEIVAGLRHGAPVLSLVFSPDGELLLTTQEEAAHLWRWEEEREIARMIHESQISSAVFHSSGRRIATADANGIARIWIVPSYGTRKRPTVLSPTGDRSAELTEAGILRIRIPGEPGELARLSGPDNGFFAISPEGRSVAVSDAFGVRLLDPTGARPPMGLKKSGGSVYHLEFSPDGRYVAAAGSGAHVWEIATGREVARVDHGSTIGNLVFSPDNRFFATASQDEKVGVIAGLEAADHVLHDPSARVWEIGTGRQVLRVDHLTGVVGLSFSPDGKRIATAGTEGDVAVWEISGGEEVARIRHGTPVSGVAYSPDGTHLATVSQEGIHIWEVEGTRELARLPVHHKVSALAFVAGGNRLVVAGEEGTAIRTWRVHDLLREACSRLTRNLSYVEWKSYLPNQPYPRTCSNLPVHSTVLQAAIRFAGEGDLAAAESIFQRVADLDPASGVEPRRQARYHRGAALAERAFTLIEENRAGEAKLLMEEADALTGGEIETWRWNSLCWLGALEGRAKEVLSACDRAVALEPGNGSLRDSRGLARALTGDLRGAMEDFAAFVRWSGSSPEQKDCRRRWIASLRSGHHPFSPKEIERLWREVRVIDQRLSRSGDMADQIPGNATHDFRVTDAVFSWIKLAPFSGRHRFDFLLDPPAGPPYVAGSGHAGFENRTTVGYAWMVRWEIPVAPESLGTWRTELRLDGRPFCFESFSVRSPIQVVARRAQAGDPTAGKNSRQEISGLGSPHEPVRTSGFGGRDEYLQRLRCPGGKAPHIHRLGSLPSPHGRLMDAYQVDCPEAKITEVIYLDLYHPGYLETAPIWGFVLEQ